MTTAEKTRKLLNTLSHRLCVKFALLCAKDVAHLVEDKGETKRCRDLVKAWLEGKDVTDKEFRSTFRDGVILEPYYYSYSAAYSAAYLAFRVGSDPDDVSHYTRLTVACAAKARNIPEDKYYDMLVDMIKDLSPLEQAIYDLGEM